MSTPYNPYSFRKVYMCAPTAGGGGLLGSGVTIVNAGVATSALTAGQIGVYPVAQTGLYGTSTVTGSNSDIAIVQGSYHTIDQITKWIGGLQMTQKSTKIKLGNVTKFSKKTAVVGSKQVVTAGWDQTVTGLTALVGPVFQAAKTYRLRVDLQGSPIMRAFARNAYYDVEAYTGCAPTTCNSGCTQTMVDPVTVMLQWKDGINQHPWLPSFIKPQVFYNNSGTKTEVFSAYDTSIGVGSGTYVSTGVTTLAATIQLTDVSVQQTFPAATYTPTDFYELAPLLILASLRMDDGSDANPCQVQTTINTSVPNMFTVITPAVQASGSGQTVARDWALSLAYQGETLPDGQEIDLFRMRGIQDDITLPNTNLNGWYDEIHITYTNNTTSNYTNDRVQYELVFYVLTGTSTTNFTTLFASFLTAAGSNVVLESY